MVQAGAVERLIDTDPDAARVATRELRLQGRQTLADLRTGVGVLRESATGASEGASEGSERFGAVAPAPGVASLRQLIDAASQIANVRLRVTGQPWPLPPIADATVYRVIEEGLSNARQYAPDAAVRIGLAWEQHRVAVTVENDAPHKHHTDGRAGGGQVSAPIGRQGLGLTGMRERAHVVNGTLHAGPTQSGGWTVHLSVPRLRDDETAESL